MRPVRGFTLIELMVVVAIIGVLSSIALPSITGAMTRARRAEQTIVRNGIHRGMTDAFMRNNYAWNPAWIASSLWEWNPALDLAATATPCNLGPPAPWIKTAGYSHWKEVEYEPEGLLRGRYGISIPSPSGAPQGESGYMNHAVSDFDSNGICVNHLDWWKATGNGDWAIDMSFITGASGLLDDGEW